MTNLQLPRDIEAERIVLASIIKDNDTISDILDLISDKDFYSTTNGVLYGTMMDMYSKDIPIEIESLCNYLGPDKLKAIGGVTYIAQLIATELTVNHAYYAKIIKEKSNKRKLITNCQEALKAAYEETAASSEIIGNLEGEFLKYESQAKEKTNNISEVMSCVLDDIEKKYALKGEIPGIKTGLVSLDKATNGYQRGDLWIIAARPSIGKTLVSLNLLSRLPSEHNAIIFEQEMTKEKLGNRLLAAESMVQSKMLARGNLNDTQFQKLIMSSGRLTEKNNIYMNCRSNVSLGYIRSEAKKIKLKYGLDVIFVDHLGLMKTSNKNNRNLEIGELTAGLKAIAKDLNVCVVCLSQLSRAVEQRQDKHPILSDLRDSGTIEQDSDTVMFLYRDDYYAERERRESTKPNTLEIFIAKNRDGEVGGIEFYCNLENQLIAEKDFRH